MRLSTLRRADDGDMALAPMRVTGLDHRQPASYVRIPLKLSTFTDGPSHDRTSAATARILP
jgi:hypothetical protein